MRKKEEKNNDDDDDDEAVAVLELGIRGNRGAVALRRHEEPIPGDVRGGHVLQPNRAVDPTALVPVPCGRASGTTSDCKHQSVSQRGPKEKKSMARLVCAAA